MLGSSLLISSQEVVDLESSPSSTPVSDSSELANLTVMLEALANGADPNWVNEEEEGRTPLMKAVETVC
jgi:hypothetical protein